MLHQPRALMCNSRGDRSLKSPASCRNSPIFCAAVPENSFCCSTCFGFVPFALHPGVRSLSDKYLSRSCFFLYRYLVMNDRRDRKSPSTGMLGNTYDHHRSNRPNRVHASLELFSFVNITIIFFLTFALPLYESTSAGNFCWVAFTGVCGVAAWGG